MNQVITETTQKALYDEVCDGLRQPRKFLPAKLFYDEKGSQLFDEICKLDEYYLTRTELMIMENNLDDIAACFDEGSLFIEYGSGSGLKSRILLNKIKDLAGYVPIDISEDYLSATTAAINKNYPDVDIYPICADYTKPVELPQIKKPVKRRIGFFPGSTIGNFLPGEAIDFLSIVAAELGKEGGLIIGIDLKKGKNILEAAYNDSKGLTAEFNFNMLHRLNNEFGFNFDLSKFKHFAPYNAAGNRIEMHLVSTEDQIVTSQGEEFEFKKWESILTEYSHKYSLSQFEDIICYDFKIKKYWTDQHNYFALLCLEVI